MIRGVLGLLPFSRSKIKLGTLVTVLVQKDLRGTVDQSAVLAVVEMLSPNWIILNILFLCLQSLLHVILTFIIVLFVGIFYCFVCYLRVLLLHPCQLLQILFNVVFNFFSIQQAKVLDLTSGFVGFFVIIEFVVRVAGCVQVLEGSEDHARPDVLLLLCSLVLLFALQFDRDHPPLDFIGQPRQLFDSVHYVSRLDRYADESALTRSPAGLLQQHHLLKIDVMCNQVRL